MAGAGIAADLLVHVGADIKDATDGLNKVSDKTDSTAAKFGKAGLAMGGASLAIVGGLGMAINTAAEYEASLSQITALGGEFAASQDKIGALALDIGQKTAFSATQGAEAIAELAKAGVPLADILGGAAMQAANLAAAGGQSIPDAAVTMSNAMNMFSLSGEDAAMIADTFAAAANASASDVSDLAMALSQGGAAAAGWGLSLAQTNTALAVFSNYGLKGSDAGTSLKAMLSGLTPVTSEAKAALEGMGISADEFANSADPMLYLTQKLTEGTKDMSTAQRQAALETIFGSDGMRAALNLINAGPDAYQKMTDAVNEQGVAQEMAKAKMDNLKGALEQLQGSLETAMIVIGTAFIPVMRKVADGITKALNVFLKLPKPLQKSVGVIAAVAAGFLALGSAIGLVIGFAGPAVAALMAILSPLLLIAAAIAAMYLAWRTNFLGIQDITKSAFGAVMEVVKPFIAFLSQVAHGSDITKETLAGIPEPLQNIAKVLGLVVRGFTDFYNALAGGRGVSAALGELWEVIGSDKMVAALSALGTQILDAFSSIDWGAVGSALWEGLQTAVGYVKDIGGPIVSKLGQLSVAISAWLIEQAGKVDWGQLATIAGQKLSSFVSTLIPMLGNLGQSLKTWFDTSVNSVDWGNLGFIVGQAVGNLAGVLGPKAWELITGLAEALRNNWKTIGTVILGLILALPATIGYVGKVMLPKAFEFLKGFTEGLGINWTSVAQWLQGLPGRALAAVPGLLGTLKEKGIQLMVGLWTGISAFWDGTLKVWLAALPTMLSDAVGELAGTLETQGIDLMVGLWTGISSFWEGSVKPWLSSLPSTITGAVGVLTYVLWQAGVDILWGFGQGALSYAQTLYDTISGIVDNIINLFKNIPGFSPIDHVGAYFGEKLGFGFAEGLASAMPKSVDVAANFRDSTVNQLQAQAYPSVAPAMAPGGASGQGNTTIIQHNNFTVDLEQFEDLAEAAAFVSNLNGTRILYKNEPLGGVI